MPQMAPLPWTLVFLLSLFSLLSISTSIYFIFKPKASALKINYKMNPLKISW